MDQIYRDIREVWNNVRDDPSYEICVTGHSLGGALATLAGFDLAARPDLPKPIKLVTFESPRVGSGGFQPAFRVSSSNEEIIKMLLHAHE